MEDLKAKLDNESSKRLTMQKSIEKHLETISKLELKVSELQDTCLTKANQITVLGEKNEDIKQQLCEVKRLADEDKKMIEKLHQESVSSTRERDELVAEIEKLTTERDQLINDMKDQKRNFDGQVRSYHFYKSKKTVNFKL